MKMFTHMTANNIKLKGMPFIRELSMEAYLIENETILALGDENDDTLSQVQIIDSELSVKQGRQSKETDGRIDLLALYGQETLGVIELKLGTISQIHLDQLADYFKTKSEIINKFPQFINATWVGVLVGDDISSDLEKKISEGYLIDGSIPVAALTIKRYRGEDNAIYVITNTYFKNTSRNFDRTRYLFENKTFGKGRLVLSVVKKYIENNPGTTFAELERVFPPTLQGSNRVFRSLEEATRIYESSGYKRYFLNPEETISLADNSRIVVCTQWGIDNINYFIKNAVSLGFEIKEVRE